MLLTSFQGVNPNGEKHYTVTFDCVYCGIDVVVYANAAGVEAALADPTYAIDHPCAACIVRPLSKAVRNEAMAVYECECPVCGQQRVVLRAIAAQWEGEDIVVFHPHRYVCDTCLDADNTLVTQGDWARYHSSDPMPGEEYLV